MVINTLVLFGKILQEYIYTININLNIFYKFNIYILIINYPSPTRSVCEDTLVVPFVCVLALNRLIANFN